MPDVFDHLLALADPIRPRLLAVLAAEELAVGELARVVQLPQSTVSRHVKALEGAGWITRRTAGASSQLRIADDLAPDARELWAAIRPPVEASPRHAEDRARLAAVLAARAEDPRGYFGRVHAGWDAVRRELFGDAALLPTLLALLDPGLVVGDLGCGTGAVVAALAPNVREVHGVDREARMLEVAAARTAGVPNAHLHQGGFGALPLADATLDAALCMLVLHHVEDLRAALADVARVVRPGGRVVVLDMVAHDRDEYRVTMGHVHLGFTPEALRAAAAPALSLASWRPLTPDPDAHGPPLFLAVLRTHAT